MKSDFKPFFMRGLAALAPTIVTIAIVVWAYRFVDDNIGRHITNGVVALYAWGGPPPLWLGITEETALTHGEPIDRWDARGRRLTTHYMALNAPSGLSEQELQRFERTRSEILWDLAIRKWKFFNFIGFVLAVVIIYVTGYLLASFFGRTTWMIIERGLLRLPIIGAIYPNIKQVTDLFIAEKKVEFSGVVAVQYPRMGIWSVGFVTGAPIRYIARDDDRDLLTVFIPSSPTPITGYTITVARGDAIVLPITIDEALRYTISGGVLKPGESSKYDKGLETSPA
jgi:uncharacterized membrane protein